MSIFSNIYQDVVAEVSDTFDDVVNFFSGVSTGQAGLTRSTGLPLNEETDNTIESVTDEGTMPDDVKQEVRDHINQGEFEQAAEKTEPFSSKDKTELISIYSVTQDTIAGGIVITDEDVILPDPFVVGGETVDPNNEFPYISSVEELEAEIHSISRPITEVVVHWTESYQNANLTATDINLRTNILQQSEGVNIPYHYVILRSGSLQRGAPIERATEHTGVGHNQNSIAIAFVGGYNTDTASEDIENNTGIRSLTRAQFNTFEQFMRVFYNKYPGGQALGHNDIEDYEDPGFDVIEYAYDKFKRASKFTDPFTQDSFDL